MCSMWFMTPVDSVAGYVSCVRGFWSTVKRKGNISDLTQEVRKLHFQVDRGLEKICDPEIRVLRTLVIWNSMRIPGFPGHIFTKFQEIFSRGIDFCAVKFR